jgi:hypothetical protein
MTWARWKKRTDETHGGGELVLFAGSPLYGQDLSGDWQGTLNAAGRSCV